MKQRIYVAIVTALVFCAGYLAGLYSEQHQPLPGPPVTFLGEFNPPKAAADPAAHSDSKPINRAEVLATVKSLLPELQKFRQQSDAIDDQFETDLDLILTPDQRVKHAEEIKRHRLHIQRDDMRPLTDSLLTSLLHEQTGRTISYYVVTQLPLDDQVKRYNLDAEQREKVRALLKTRRDRFLALVDSSPPPSVMLSRLAPLVERLAQPAPATAPAPVNQAPAP